MLSARNRYSLRIVRLVVLLLLLTGSAGLASSYTVGPGDQIEVQVSGEKDLSGLFSVSSQGTIAYPLLGVLRVAGLSQTAITGLIKEQLGRDYIVSPQVVVYIRDYASKKVAVLGDVPNPGFYALKEGSSLLSLLTEAGLMLNSEGGITIIVTSAAQKGQGKRGEITAPTVMDLESLLNPWQEQTPLLLSPGDRVFVRSGTGGKVIVSGKVRTPGMVALGDGLTVNDDERKLSENDIIKIMTDHGFEEAPGERR